MEVTQVAAALTAIARRQRRMDDELRALVLVARRAGLSWDAISVALGGVPNGETLRRRFGGSGV